MNKDKIYQYKHNSLQDFRFDTNVVPVFDNMILRSVPGYENTLDLIRLLVTQYAKDNTALYDLGCSLGRITQIFLEKQPQHYGPLFAIDLSQDMIEQCQKNLKPISQKRNINYICKDITQITLKKSSIIVLNYTLQFISPDARNDLLTDICDALIPGGILIISEKINGSSPKNQQFLTDMHISFKQTQGYSDLEISQKRNALEKVLIPDTLNELNKRIKQAGFTHSEIFSQSLNFISLVGFR
jgi:tRNA (cmo5U34)-methyltransferase